MPPPLIYLISLAVNLAQLVSTSVALPAELVSFFNPEGGIKVGSRRGSKFLPFYKGSADIFRFLMR